AYFSWIDYDRLPAIREGVYLLPPFGRRCAAVSRCSQSLDPKSRRDYRPIFLWSIPHASYFPLAGLSGVTWITKLDQMDHNGADYCRGALPSLPRIGKAHDS